MQKLKIFLQTAQKKPRNFCFYRKKSRICHPTYPALIVYLQQKKRNPNSWFPFLFFIYTHRRLSFVDSFARAVFCASSAADASVSIDFVDIAFRDSFNWAQRCASSASYTRIIDYVSHFIRIYLVCYAICFAQIILFLFHQPFGIIQQPAQRDMQLIINIIQFLIWTKYN